MKALEWILRLAVAGEFLGHGVYALRGEPTYLALITGTVGWSEELSLRALVVIGALSLGIGAQTLFKPWRPSLLFGGILAMLAAAAYPLGGGESWSFLERWPNWAAPLALWLVLSKSGKSDWR